MITQQHTEEDLSKAYVMAVGAKAGLSVHFRDAHDYGVDGSLHQVSIVNGKRQESGYSFDFQLKASKRCSIDAASSLVYDLDADTYNFLCDRARENRATPIVLLLLALPEDEADWLSVSPERMIMKKACYWTKIDGKFTDNVATKRVAIPQGRLFDVAAAGELMRQVRETGGIA